MDFKIIYLAKYEAEVCLCRRISLDGEEIVCILSFIADENEAEYMLESKMSFETAEFSQDFVRDYTPESAENWIVSKAGDQGINLV